MESHWLITTAAPKIVVRCLSASLSLATSGPSHVRKEVISLFRRVLRVPTHNVAAHRVFSLRSGYHLILESTALFFAGQCRLPFLSLM